MKLTKSQTANLIRVQAEDVAHTARSEGRRHWALMSPAQTAQSGFSRMHANSTDWMIRQGLAVAVPTDTFLSDVDGYRVWILRLTDAGRAAIA